MKKITSLFCLVFFSGLSAQINLASDFKFHYNEIEIADSIVSKQLDYSVKYSVRKPLTNTYQIYSKHYKYLLKTGNCIYFDVYNDTSILYRESFATTDSILNRGEFIIDRLNFKVETINTVNTNGEDSLVYDTIFNLSPNGYWNLTIDHHFIETGEYSNGNKEGEWYVFNSQIDSRFPNQIVRKKTYAQNVLIHEIQMDISRSASVKEQSDYLTKQWYSPGVTLENQKIVQLGYKPLYIFSTDSTKLVPHGYFYFYYIQLKKNKTFESKKGFWCGTGISKEDRNPKGKWEIEKVGVIKIGEILYQIEYLSEDTLILSI